MTDVFITLQHMMCHITIISDSELDSVKALFNEKEKELSLAVARVEHLTKQLEEIQNGKLSGINGTTQSAAVAELEKLRKELVVSRSYWVARHRNNPDMAQWHTGITLGWSFHKAILATIHLSYLRLTAIWWNACTY